MLLYLYIRAACFFSLALIGSLAISLFRSAVCLVVVFLSKNTYEHGVKHSVYTLCSVYADTEMNFSLYLLCFSYSFFFFYFLSSFLLLCFIIAAFFSYVLLLLSSSFVLYAAYTLYVYALLRFIHRFLATNTLLNC